jgi:hypothetical protein
VLLFECMESVGESGNSTSSKSSNISRSSSRSKSSRSSSRAVAAVVAAVVRHSCISNNLEVVILSDSSDINRLLDLCLPATRYILVH